MMKKKEPREFVIPEWAKVLREGPLALSEETDIEAFISALERRLGALLHLHGCEPTPDGWRTLALRLALGYVLNGKQVVKIETPATVEYGGRGRPKERMAKFWIKEIDWQRQHAKPEEGKLTIKEAAERVRKKYQKSNIRLRQRGEPEDSIPEHRTLENIYSAANSKPKEIEPLPWSMMVHLLMDQAAMQLQEKSRKVPVLP